MSLDDIEYRAHAILGPSGTKKWAICTMAPTAERHVLEDTTHERTRYGTCGHLVLAECLEHSREPESYLGRDLIFMTGHVEVWEEDIGVAHEGLTIQHTVKVDAEMVAKTMTIINYVHDLLNATGGELYVEQRLSIEHITKERGACGTTDVGIAARRQRRLIILDAKYGFVKVHACDTTIIDGVEHRTPNLQLAMYAEAFLNEHDPFGFDFDEVTLIIAQPFVNPPFNEATFTRAELAKTIAWLAERAEKTRVAPEYSPNTESCMWCKAKATCSARTRLVMDLAAEGFDEVAAPSMTVADVCNAFGVDPIFDTPAPQREIPPLGVRYEMIGMIRDWCNDQERLVHAELHAGRPVVGKKGPYKLAQGARGDRKWSDSAAAAKYLSDELLLDDAMIYSRKVVGPAKIEELTVGKNRIISKEAWAAMQQVLVTRGEQGPPKIVLASDPAPAVESPTDGFVDVPDVGET